MITKETSLQPSEIAAQIAEHYAADDAHGYSQPNREGTGGWEEVALSDGGAVSIPTGDVDCSKLSINCYAHQDIDTSWASYTGNMVALLDSGNFVNVGVDNRQRGDILNSTVAGHAAVYLGNGLLAEAHHGDFPGGISGETGDQDGTEVRICDYYDDAWTACYRCTVEREPPTPRPVGWIEDGGRWWYRHADGTYTVDGWERIDGLWYRFDDGGWMQTNWVYDGRWGGWFYLNGDRASKTYGALMSMRSHTDENGRLVVDEMRELTA